MGTIINSIAVILGGLLGNLTGKLFNKEQQDSLCRVCGISTLFIAISGAMEGMMKVENNILTDSRTMLVVISLALGTIVGELVKIEDAFERFGEWLKIKTGNGKDSEFVNAFVTTSLTICIGAMAIVGAIQDGIMGDYSTLAVKSVLDFIIVAIMTASMGKGCVFSVIPILLLEGTITLLARIVSPVMTDLAISYLSLIGSILIFCVGINLVWGKRLRVANMLPALIVAVIAAYIAV